MKPRIVFLYCIVTIFIATNADATNRRDVDSSLTLVVKPTADIRFGTLDPNDRVHLAVADCRVRLPRILYDCLNRERCIDLRTRFDELISLREDIPNFRRSSYIDTTLKILRYHPEAWLFTSIEKETGHVVLRAEILDRAAHPLAISSRRIRRDEFLDDSRTRQNIEEIARELGGSICNPRKHSIFHVGIGFRCTQNACVTLRDIPVEIRTTPPHIDDVTNRPDEILPTEQTDNYVIMDNDTRIRLGYEMALDIHVSFWDLLFIAVRTAGTDPGSVSINNNLLKKQYIFPVTYDPYRGSAAIYYSVEATPNTCGSRNSLSLPVYIDYPVCRFGTRRNFILRILGGTTVLLPERVSFVAEQGWDRYNDFEVYETRNLGEITETEWFIGVGIEQLTTVNLRFGMQAMLIFTDYRETFTFPVLHLDSEDHLRLSLRVYMAY